MAASANSTSSSTRSYRDFITNVKNLDARFQRVPKAPGSKELIHGEFVEVKAED